MTDVTVVIGAGGIGQAIARRISSGRHILVANHSQESADAAATVLEGAGFEITAMQADVSDRAMVQAVVRKAQELGPIKALVQAAGVSPSQAPIEEVNALGVLGRVVPADEVLVEIPMFAIDRSVTTADENRRTREKALFRVKS